jgi:hypothetical protein
MRKKDIWKYLTLAIATILMLSLAPEVRLFALLVDAIGIDVFILLLESQVIVLFLGLYHQKVSPIVSYLDAKLKKWDPYYFVPSVSQIRQYPPLAFHSAPFLVGLYLMFIVNVPIYA